VGRTAIILAGGLGTRMKSSLHKVLHPILGKPMILHILHQLMKVDIQQIIVVVGQHREQVMEVVGTSVEYAIQEEQLGTGHAVLAALPLVKADSKSTVVLYGDAPLIQATTIQALLDVQSETAAAGVVLTARVENPTGLGRVFVDAGGSVEKIVEERDASPEERENHCINTGIYAFDTRSLGQACKKLTPSNAQKEYYLTDVLPLLKQQGLRVVASEIANSDEIASVNDRVQLAQVEKLAQAARNRELMQSGVTMLHPESTYVGADVTIGRDTVLYPATHLEGKTSIGEQCIVGPNSRLLDATVHDNATIQYSVVLQSVVGEHASVGPFAYIRPGSTIGEHAKVGDFVEIKNTHLGKDSKVSHLAYLGDAYVGERVNIGCGVITVNYDGEKKYRTEVGDDSFIGSNSNLIAPVRVGRGAYVCAGSTITNEVPDDAFAIGRAHQVTKEQYVKRWKLKRQSAGSAGRESQDEF
jgi:bifunctional UDP-N-acetylglucosamine pyrophosphorylase/glucosamine-1-phosphate N-acetyltransferase